ncbi:hypothetical protein YSA_07071 [Pseudomonas putida ND6]|uniref:Uncharacterized protein n=1 Tax=Pseudomonas putida ND6 TaxID=231023 RepID=I3UYL5_PSEPU|nr:hypothetical protein YSA_07071 [Pseudomonas putida ND6]
MWHAGAANMPRPWLQHQVVKTRPEKISSKAVTRFTQGTNYSMSRR